MKSCKVMAEFSISPIGQDGTSLSRFVAASLVALNGVKVLRFEVTPIGTILEADSLDTILDAVKVAHEVLVEKGFRRVESTLRIDDRRD